MSQHTAVVIGAGPAGLTAAYELRKRGVTASVLEGSTQVGGLSASAASTLAVTGSFPKFPSSTNYGRKF